MNSNLTYNEAVLVISRSIDGKIIKDAFHASSILSVLFDSSKESSLEDIVEERKKILKGG